MHLYNRACPRMNGPKLVATVAVLSAIACRPTPQVQYQQQLDKMDSSAQHAVHSDRLERVMVNLESITFESMPYELDLENEREPHLREIARLATAMAGSAAHIADAVPDQALNEEEFEEFKSLAESLRTDALALRQQAQQKDLHAIPQTWKRIIATCDQCHGRFRDVPPITETKPAK